MNGPVIIREKPATHLVGRLAYQLDEGAGMADYVLAAAWVGEYGGTVPHVDDQGLLVRTIDGEGVIHTDWMSAPCLIVRDPDEPYFEEYGYSMGYNYELERDDS